jgi:hypothetical protein
MPSYYTYLISSLPMLSFGNILNQRSYSPSINFNDVPNTDNLNVRGLLTVPLYSGGRMTADKPAAQSGTAAALKDAEAIRQSLGGEVARAFFTVQKTRQFIAAAQAAITSYETNTALARKRFDAGSALRADVLDLEVRLAQAPALGIEVVLTPTYSGCPATEAIEADVAARQEVEQAVAVEQEQQRQDMLAQAAADVNNGAPPPQPFPAKAPA